MANQAVSLRETRPLNATGKDWRVVAAVGAGLDYFVARNIAVGVEGAYHLSRGHRMALVGRGHDLELNWLSTTLGLRLYFAGTGRP